MNTASLTTTTESPGLRFHRVQRFSLHDGPGIRTTVFLQGCRLRCWWCHNPELWAEDFPGVGAKQPAELLAELEHDAPYWNASGGGITIGGGEPLLQSAAVAALLTAAQQHGHSCAVDTSGTGRREEVQQLVPVTDLWLWDLKFVRPATARAGTGNTLEACQDNLAWLLAHTATPVRVRVPLIAGFNAAAAEVHAMADWLGRQSRRPAVDILCGHNHGPSVTEGPVPKRRIVPTPEEVTDAVRVFRDAGFTVFVGGGI